MMDELVSLPASFLATLSMEQIAAISIALGTTGLLLGTASLWVACYRTGEMERQLLDEVARGCAAFKTAIEGLQRREYERAKAELGEFLERLDSTQTARPGRPSVYGGTRDTGVSH
jgi:hypothetical protein